MIMMLTAKNHSRSVMLYLGSYIEIPHKISKKKWQTWFHTIEMDPHFEKRWKYRVLYMVVIPRPYMYY